MEKVVVGIDCDWRGEVHGVNVCVFLTLLSMHMAEQYM